jgi:hypothetical protein
VTFLFQEERLNTLRRRLQIPFDGSRIEHQVRIAYVYHFLCWYLHSAK